MIFDALFAEYLDEVDRRAVISSLKESGSAVLLRLGTLIESNRIKMIVLPEPPKPKLPELIAGERL